MKIILIEPPVLDRENITSFKYPPLGLIALAAYLRENKHQVFLIDANAEKNPRQKILEILEKEKPQMAGIGAMSVNIDKAFQIAELIKYFSPETLIVLGGIHPTIEPEKTLENKFVDFVVRGEGEITFLELIESVEKKRNDFEKTKGLAFKKDGQIIINPTRELIPNLDILPIPAYDLLDAKKYRAPYAARTPFMIMARSRGCPFDCTFCGVSSMFGHSHRVQSPQRTLMEVDYLTNKMGIKEIGFKDSEFTLNQKNVEKLCELLIKKKYDLVWNCNGRANHADLHFFQKMKEAGCQAITFGIESGDQKILNILKKQITVEQAKEAVRNSKQAGLKVVGNFMIGNPADTEETIQKTINFAKELNLDYAYFGFTTPFPGTKLRQQAEEGGWILNKANQAVKYEALIMNATFVPTKKLKTYLNRAYRSFYFRPAYIFKRLLKLDKNELYNSFKGLSAILSDFFQAKKA